MSQTELDQAVEGARTMGPIDYVVLAWPSGQPTGKAAPLIVDLVDRGIIRILDVAYVAKDADGKVSGVEASHFGPDSQLDHFDGASSGLLDAADLEDAAAALDPNSSAAILVWENSWAAPVAIALRESGGQLIDGGRIPVQGIIAALDALEAAETN